MSGHIMGNQSNEVKYIYELPYTERKFLCNILDMDNQWEKLGGTYMNFKVHELQEMRRVEKWGDSPCDRLLQIWGHQNNTVSSLYSLLYKMKHYQAMKVLLPFIPSKYHSLAFKGEQSLTSAFSVSGKQNSTGQQNTDFSRISSITNSHAEGAAALPKPPQDLLVSARINSRGSATAGARLNGSISASVLPQNAQGPSQVNNHLHNFNNFIIDGAETVSQMKPHLVSKKIDNTEFVRISTVSCDENEHAVCPSLSDFDKEYLEMASAKLNRLQNKIDDKREDGRATAKRKAESNAGEDKLNSPPPSSSHNNFTQTDVNSMINSNRKPCIASEASIRSDSTSVGPSVPVISFSDLTVATSNWNKNYLLGKGGFGEVYWGTWKNTEVAVKKMMPTRDLVLDGTPLPISQTVEELRLLQAYRHDNILQLYGCSADPGQPTCLVYQFMVNGSVEDILRRPRRTHGISGGEEHHSSYPPSQTPPHSRTTRLDWWQRLNIAIGTAKALQFLHTVKDKPLIHGDIKSANILLDGNLEPKLGDFGLAKEGPMSPSSSKKVDRVDGTRPYLPEEYLRDKKLSAKVDCYSYGVVLFELCTGLKPYCEKRPRHKFLKELVCVDAKETGFTDDSLQDPKAGLDVSRVFPALLQLGKECVVRMANLRPNMASVYQRLEDFSRQEHDQRLSQISMASFASSHHMWGGVDSTLPSNVLLTHSTNPSSQISFLPSNISQHSSIPANSRVLSPEHHQHLIQQHHQLLPMYTYHPQQYIHNKYNPYNAPNHGMRYLTLPSQYSPQYNNDAAANHAVVKASNGSQPQQLLPDLSALSLKPDGDDEFSLPDAFGKGSLPYVRNKTEPSKSVHSLRQGEQVLNNNADDANYAQQYMQHPQQNYQIPNQHNSPVNNLYHQAPGNYPHQSPMNHPHHQSPINPIIPLVVNEVGNCQHSRSSHCNASESGIFLPMLTVLGNKVSSAVDIHETQQSNDKSESTVVTDFNSSSSNSSHHHKSESNQNSNVSISAKGKSSFLD